MAHKAIIKTQPSLVQDGNVTVFISYDDNVEHSHSFSASLTDEQVMEQARAIAKERVEKLNQADALAHQLEQYHEEVVG